MALPNPGMNFTPFDTLPASDLDDMVENIEALAAGSGLNDGAIPYSKLLSTIFSGQVQSQANSGSAGGTMRYINLGGIRLLWAISSTGLVAGAAYQFVYPAAFFSTIQCVQATAHTPSGFANQYANTASSSTTLSAHYLMNDAGGASGTSAISILVIGT